MRPPPDTSWLRPPPRAEVTQSGRMGMWFTVYVYVDGMCESVSYVIGRRRAERKARRMLTRGIAARRRREEATTIVEETT